MKECFKCKKQLPLDSFYKHPEMKDGRVNKCKDCNKKDVKENRAAKIDYYQEYDRARANRPDRVKAREEYAKTEEGKAAHNKAKQRWSDANQIKRAASIIVNNAIRSGKLSKGYKCSECGKSEGKIHGHHDDYTKPLDVRWLCPKCHSDWHKQNGEGFY